VCVGGLVIAGRGPFEIEQIEAGDRFKIRHGDAQQTAGAQNQMAFLQKRPCLAAGKMLQHMGCVNHGA